MRCDPVPGTVPAVFLLCAFALPAVAADSSPRVTILPSGAAVIEETLDWAAGPGGPVDIFVPPGLEPGTAMATLGPDQAPLELVSEPPLDGVAELLRRCEGQTVRLLPGFAGSGQPTLPETGELVAGGGTPLVRTSVGTVAVPPERIACSVEGDARPRLRVLLPESKSARTVHLRYWADGFAWQARHRLDLQGDSGQARLAAGASLDVPPGVHIERAALRLAEGDVPRAPGPVRMFEPMMKSAMAPARGESLPVEGRAFDLVLFDLPRPVTLNGPQHLDLPLRSAAKIGIEDVLVLDLHRSPAAPVPDQPFAPRRHIRFLIEGDQPLPGGIVEVGVDRADGRWLPLGEVPTPHVAPGRTADVVLGEVRDVVAQYRRPTLAVLPDGPFQREATVEVELENHRDRGARLEVTQDFGGPFELVESSPAPDRRDGTSLTWLQPVERSAVKTIRVRVRFEPRVREPR